MLNHFARALRNILLQGLLSFVEAKLVLVVLRPANNLNSHAKRIKLQHLQRIKLRLKLLHIVIHLLEIRIV
jgi:hypothetical protein